MSALKLYYFKIRGLAEPIRLMLADNGVAFENIMFQKDAAWPEYKKQFAFGQVPCLKEDGMEIPQSGAIIRHLARKLNLAGDTEEEKVFADFFSEGLKDLHDKYCDVIYRNYEAGKDEFVKTAYPAEWAKVDALFKKHGNGEKFVLGDKLSYADYLLFEELDIALILSSTVLDAFPALKGFHERFSKRQGFQAHIAARTYPVNNNGKQ